MASASTPHRFHSRAARALRGSAALLLTAAAGCGSEPAESSLLLLTLDTTIPEALSCYEVAGGKTTPTLDAIAAEGLLFENARTVAPLTLPAHASMLTGLVPPRHTVRMNGAMILPAEADTLAERARAGGYQTAAFVAAVVLGAGFGLEQGFDVYDQPTDAVGTEDRLEAAREADEMVDRALRWMREERDPDRPFFAWVHFFDPHQPYDPPPEHLRAMRGNAYLGEVRSMDTAIGRLVAGLEELGLWDETIVAVVSDHGEGLGRHGEATHGPFVYDTTIRVPMLLRHPDGRRAGEREAAPTSVVDLFPTLVHELGWGTAGDVDGYDLWRGELPADRGAYFESYYGYMSFGWSPATGWADARTKYNHAREPELFDLAHDADEERNLLPGAQELAAAKLDRIRRIEQRSSLGLQGVADGSGRISAQIEALGYAGAAGLGDSVPAPTQPVDLPSPHARIEEYADFLAARDLQSRGRPEEAIPLLEGILETNPANHSAAFNLGTAYIAVQRYEDALPVLDLAIEHRRGEWIGGVLNKAVVLQNLGRRQDAVPLYEQAFRLGDGPPGALEAFVELLQDLGDEQRLATYRERLRSARGASPR